MVDFHTKTLYGQKSSVIITSPAKMVPYVFLSCINRKDDGTWEQTSKGEGKTVKLSIEEIICVLGVLKKHKANWRGYHIYKDRQTEIYVGWEDESRHVLRIKLGDYTKKLRFPNLNFMILLLEHILSEKIEFATSGTFEGKVGEEVDEEREYGLFTEQITARNGLNVVETTEYDVSHETMELKAKIKVESPKALLMTFDIGKEFWIPKSTIHSQYDVNNKETVQLFVVDKWIIERNQIFQKKSSNSR